MSLLFESIACKNYVLENLRFHEERMNRSRKKLFGVTSPLSLGDISIPDFVDKELWKCRVSFAENIEQVAFQKYVPTNPSIFRIVDAEIEYQHKFEDRNDLDTLFSNRGEADDIIIIVNDRITDSSIANLIFYDGTNWLTPIRPLLPGTMRAQLIDSGLIIEKDVRKSDLVNFERFMAINALNPFDPNRSLPISHIVH